MKYFIAAALVLIIGALASAGVFLMRDGRDGKPKTSNMMRALAVRVGLSVLLFLCILLAYKMGWIRPTGIPIER
ncbi:twin transmembrane helix small protein [Piscinibacter sp. HJYY11]|uniref:twin transmembrane helix small protein n=1 Tax=Piscinibacter sp. HJYY11 TaxID=2801333 RepID=UPI00191CC177|nr:twin transmembrane helix small protein [Piscinibacter sp. HJYY11]MBL0730201.1 twin transmembrane helix small protein [Piscinibacter sp. HJYY11]